METNPRGYQALHARLSQCSDLSLDARLQLAQIIQRAPHTYTRVLELTRALVLIIEADDIIHAARNEAHGFALAEEAQQSADQHAHGQ
jgi:hypothetical protein